VNDLLVHYRANYGYEPQLDFDDVALLA